MEQQGSIIGSFLPLILLFAIFYFLIIRPQQKAQKVLNNTTIVHPVSGLTSLTGQLFLGCTP